MKWLESMTSLQPTQGRIVAASKLDLQRGLFAAIGAKPGGKVREITLIKKL
jgi:hypothetical protein